MYKMDDITRKIIQELEQDGRISNIKLAERVGLSQSACLRRVQELERSGIITGYRAVIDRSKLDGGFTVIVAVGLLRHQTEDRIAFAKAMAAAPEVLECHHVTGDVEYILRVEVSDLQAYKQFHTETLGTCAQLSKISSHIVMESPKDVG